MPARKQRLSGAEANLRQYYLSTKRGAKRRKLPFSLSLARFRELTSSPCFFCGYPPSKEYRHSKKVAYYSKEPYVCHGIDRLQNHRGYSYDNSIACCWVCNRAKGTLTVEEFLLYIYRTYNHSIKPALLEGVPHVEPSPLDDSEHDPND